MVMVLKGYDEKKKRKKNNACSRKKHEGKKITENLVERRWVNFSFLERRKLTVFLHLNVKLDFKTKMSK